MIGDGEDPESIKRGAWLRSSSPEVGCGSLAQLHGAYSYRERVLGYPNTDLCTLAPGGRLHLPVWRLDSFWMKAAAERGWRFSYCITSGNEPDSGCRLSQFRHRRSETRQWCCSSKASAGRQSFMHAAGRASPWQARTCHQERRDARNRRRRGLPLPALLPAITRRISQCASATAS